MPTDFTGVKSWQGTTLGAGGPVFRRGLRLRFAGLCGPQTRLRDRCDFFNYAQPDQVAKILTETKLLLHELYRRGGVDAILPELSAITRGKPSRTAHFEVA
jgi:hypothetical protein